MYPGEREVEGVMRPPLDLTFRHQMASLSFEKMGKFQKLTELKKEPLKTEKFLIG
jgi:hypothetical protein